VNVTKNTAYALMIVAVAMWATSGPFAELAYREDATVIEVTTFAFIIGTLILLVLVTAFDRRSLRIKRKDLLPFIGFSLIAGVLLNLAWFGAIDETSVAITVVLNYSYPSLVTVASVFLFKERFTIQKALALPLTFVGCVLVAGGGQIEQGLSFNWFGIGLGLASAAATAVYYLWGKKFEETYSPNTIVLYMFVISTVFLVVVANPIELARTSLSGNAWFWILNVAFWSGVVGFVPSMVALKHLEASKASIVASIEPVFAVTLAFIMLAEGISLVQVAGVGLVVLGVLLLRARITTATVTAPI
jgi:drug/metabolite transporter (DMT)-like permease